MVKKYGAYMNMIGKRTPSENSVSVKKLTTNNSNKIIKNISRETVVKEFMNKNDVELIFPGHIRSYYASSEF